MSMMTTGQLAEQLDLELQGDPNVPLFGVAGIAEAEPGDLSFIHSPKYVDKISTTKAAALIVPTNLETDFRPVLRSDAPYMAFAKAISILAPGRQAPPPGVHRTAVLGCNVFVGEGISIQAHVIVEDDTIIGDNAVLYPMVYAGRGSVIGEGTVIHPRVTLGEKVIVGARCIIHPGTSIGSEASSLVFKASSDRPSVEIGDNVEIGSNVVIARGDRTPTRIGSGTKIDNLVQIGSGAQIGQNCIIVAQTGIGDNAVLEDGVTLAGQAAIRPGMRVGRGATIAAQSVVETDVPEGQVFFGFPAKPHDQEMRIKVCINRLPNLFKTVKDLEKKMEDSLKGHSDETSTTTESR